MNFDKVREHQSENISSKNGHEREENSMDEKVFVGYSYGSFETDDKRQQEYCNVFMLEDFTGDQNDRYHFLGQKAVKYKCADTSVFSGVPVGTTVRCYFDGKGKLVLMKPVDSAKKT